MESFAEMHESACGTTPTFEETKFTTLFDNSDSVEELSKKLAFNVLG